MAFPEKPETQNTESGFTPDNARNERPPESGRVEIESTLEKQENRSQIQNENQTGRESRAFPGTTAPTIPATPAVKSPELVKIEHILQEDLAVIYQQLDPKHQAKMKQEGELAATKIDQLIRTAKITAKKVLDIIRHWLKSIPGVNKHYLEQEAKIKTDKILAMNRDQRP
ncbi:MAG: hypothetical protein WC734_02170 [Patescibacteria group bacterium]|jgi:hypothetical protein